ncbi:hypothetical protein CP532_5070 [Ophiocordyceps camponoti-leonardi (nom. inval.)]|nr:hypothetical protein CP532_5070 [Ophiocordyceps camponoti-leonardi (nom. inval.)]
MDCCAYCRRRTVRPGRPDCWFPSCPGLPSCLGLPAIDTTRSTFKLPGPNYRFPSLVYLFTRSAGFADGPGHHGLTFTCLLWSLTSSSTYEWPW